MVCVAGETSKKVLFPSDTPSLPGELPELKRKGGGEEEGGGDSPQEKEEEKKEKKEKKEEEKEEEEVCERGGEVGSD